MGSSALPNCEQWRLQSVHMPYDAHDARLVEIPPEHVEYLRDVIERRGVIRAAKLVGVGRTALLGVMARGTALPGTAALLREAMRRRAEFGDNKAA